MKKRILLVVVCCIILVGCGGSTDVAQQIESKGQEASSTIVPINTPVSTNTPLPTKTLVPSSTPRPTATSTPVPEPLIFEESGDKIITLEDQINDPRVLKISNSGSSNFIVKSYDQNGNYIDLLVNEIGNYQGTMLINMMLGDDPIHRFEVKSGGNWKLEILPFDIQYMDVLQVPGLYQGQGDSVVVITGEPDIVTFTTTERGNFIVYSYTNERRELLLNEIGPYSGEKILPKDLILLTIRKNGAWSMDITAK